MTDEERQWWRTYRMAWKQMPMTDTSLHHTADRHQFAFGVATLAHGERSKLDKHLGDAIRPLVQAAVAVVKTAVIVGGTSGVGSRHRIALDNLHAVLLEHHLWPDS